MKKSSGNNHCIDRKIRVLEGQELFSCISRWLEVYDDDVASLKVATSSPLNFLNTFELVQLGLNRFSK